MNTEILYFTDRFAPSEYMIFYHPITGRRPGTDASGYGKAISSDYTVRMRAGIPRRIYHTCMSNVSTSWVKIGKKYYFRDGELEDVIAAQITEYTQYITQDVESPTDRANMYPRVLELVQIKYPTIPLTTISSICQRLLMVEFAYIPAEPETD